MKCIVCNADSNKPVKEGEAVKIKNPNRLPRGWKRKGEATYCDKCWRERYVLRAITIPVLRPLGEGIGWPELKIALREAWSDATACANWMASELYARDVKRAPGAEKISPMPKVYLYPEATQRFPTIPPAAIASMEQTIHRKYGAKRYQVLWTAECSTSNYKYPFPATYPSQAWTASYQPAGADGGDLVPCVSVPIRRGNRMLLQLRGGKEFYRQLSAFKQIVDGRATPGEISFLRQRVSDDHHNGVTDRDSGKQHARYRVMCKIVGWFPRRPIGEVSGIMSVRTDVDAMLVALDEKNERLWWYNGDQIKRWQAEHKRRLDRWSDDQKHEFRPDVPFQSLRERVVQKQQNRLKTAIHQMVTCVCGLAVRRKYAEIKYDDSERRYLPQFPWAALADRLEVKCNEVGLKYVHASAGVVKANEDGARELINEKEITT